MPVKKEEKKARGTAINLPKDLSDEITTLADELGIQKSKIRGWIADHAIYSIRTVGVREIVADYLRPLLRDATTDSE